MSMNQCNLGRDNHQIMVSYILGGNRATNSITKPHHSYDCWRSERAFRERARQQFYLMQLAKFLNFETQYSIRQEPICNSPGSNMHSVRLTTSDIRHNLLSNSAYLSRIYDVRILAIITLCFSLKLLKIWT